LELGRGIWEGLDVGGGGGDAGIVLIYIGLFLIFFIFVPIAFFLLIVLNRKNHTIIIRYKIATITLSKLQLASHNIC
jgi:hypothetical protein